MTANKLSSILPGVIIGGGVFNTQMNDDPLKLPIANIIAKAFAAGARAIDTSPYYGPSETLIGKALAEAIVQDSITRADYILMTKVGRIALDRFDYSADWVKSSVERSLNRLGTSYLDVVFCHDVEFVTEEEVLEALSTLFDLQAQGVIRFVGISGYPPSAISDLLPAISNRFGRGPDVIQNYSHFNLQNTVLEKHIDHWKSFGVDCVINSSPLSMGLLSGRRAAAFHPAPPGLREATLQVAKKCEHLGYELPEIALKYVVGYWNLLRDRNGGGAAIFGVSSEKELDDVVNAYRELMVGGDAITELGNRRQVNTDKLDLYEPIFAALKAEFGEWLDYSWDSPPSDFVRKRH
jgi:D-arabinose 1-dehydrogenase